MTIFARYENPRPMPARLWFDGELCTAWFGQGVSLSLLRSWLFLDRFPPTSERTPSAARSPDRFPLHSVESPVSPEAAVGCYLRSPFPLFLVS